MADENLAAARADLYRGYATRLESLAAWCDEQRLPERAALVRSWLPVRQADRQLSLRPRRLSLARGCRTAAASDAADPEGPPDAQFAERFGPLRREQAAALYRLAEHAAEQHQASLACQLVSEAAREDSACRRAWRFLGYTQYHDAWQTPFEIEQLKAGKALARAFRLAAQESRGSL